MPICCAILSCNNNLKKAKREGKRIQFHSFPHGKDPETLELQQEWVRRCNRGNQVRPETYRICSEHFDDDEYERDLRNELLNLPIRRRLKKTAIPTLKLNDGEKNEKSQKKVEPVKNLPTTSRTRRQVKKSMKALENEATLSKKIGKNRSQLTKSKEIEVRIEPKTPPKLERSRRQLKRLRKDFDSESTTPQKKAKNTIEEISSVMEESRDEFPQQVITEGKPLQTPTGEICTIYINCDESVLDQLSDSSLTKRRSASPLSDNLLENGLQNEEQYNKKINKSIQVNTIKEATAINSNNEDWEKKYKTLLQIHVTTRLKLDKIKSDLKNDSWEQKYNDLFKTHEKKMTEMIKEISQLTTKLDDLKELRNVFSQNQIDYILYKKNRIKWTFAENAAAYNLLSHSKEAYLFIKDEMNYPLPTIKSLEVWAKKQNLSSDIFDNINVGGECEIECESTI